MHYYIKMWLKYLYLLLSINTLVLLMVVVCPQVKLYKACHIQWVYFGIKRYRYGARQQTGVSRSRKLCAFSHLVWGVINRQWQVSVECFALPMSLAWRNIRLSIYSLNYFMLLDKQKKILLDVIVVCHCQNSNTISIFTSLYLLLNCILRKFLMQLLAYQCFLCHLQHLFSHF